MRVDFSAARLTAVEAVWEDFYKRKLRINESNMESNEVYQDSRWRLYTRTVDGECIPGR